MSLESAKDFIKRLHEDQEFRWSIGGCVNKFERRGLILKSGYRFTPAELACATSKRIERTPDRVVHIEKAIRLHGENPNAFI